MTFVQRFGSALHLTPHFHSLVLDGVYAGPAHSPRAFLPLPPPETQVVARVMAETARRVMRLIERRRWIGVCQVPGRCQLGTPLPKTLIARLKGAWRSVS